MRRFVKKFLKKKWLIGILAVMVVMAGVLCFFWPYITAGRQMLYVQEIFADCRYDVQCQIYRLESGEAGQVTKMLEYMGISIEAGRIAGEKQGDLIHMSCYLPEKTGAAVEAYGSTEDILLNVRPIYEYLRTNGTFSGFMQSILPEMQEDGFVSLSRFTGEEKRGIEISDGLLSELDWRVALVLRRCEMPKDSAFSSRLEDMYFFRLEGEEGSCILGIDKKVQKDCLNCYVSINSMQLEAEALINCRQEELALTMPQESLSSWQLQVIEWIGELLGS